MMKWGWLWRTLMVFKHGWGMRVNFLLLFFLPCAFYWVQLHYIVNVQVIWWHGFVAFNFVMCKSLDGTYIYVIATCHVHICGKCDFYFIFPLLLLCFVRFFSIWPFLVGWWILLFIVLWLIFPFLISWLILHFLVKFVIMLFMDGQFYFATLGRHFVYMSIVYFVYY
jgi:hypothetical protein